MKSPRQVRSNIRTLTTNIGQIRDALHKKVDVTVAEVGKECKRSSDVLAELLMYGSNSPGTWAKVRSIGRACGVKAN